MTKNPTDAEIDDLLQSEAFRHDLVQALEASGHHGELDAMDQDELRHAARELLGFLQSQAVRASGNGAELSTEQVDAMLGDEAIRGELRKAMERSGVGIAFEDLARDQQVELLKSFLSFQMERHQMADMVEKLLTDESIRKQLTNLQAMIKEKTGQEPSLEQLAEDVILAKDEDEKGESGGDE